MKYYTHSFQMDQFDKSDYSRRKHTDYGIAARDPAQAIVLVLGRTFGRCSPRTAGRRTIDPPFR